MQIANYWIAVISHARPNNVPKIQTLIGNLATWYVGSAVDEARAYQYTGAGSVVRAGSLVAARNQALTDAWERGLTCIQLSDDITSVREMYLKHEGKGSRRPISFWRTVEWTKEELDKTPFKLAGVAPNDSNFAAANNAAANTWIKTYAAIIADFILVKPCDLKFDPAFSLKEDYDYTAQHLTRYGGVVRNDHIALTVVHRINAGGAVQARTRQLEQDSIRLLNAKWPGLFKQGRNDYEIALKPRGK